MNQRLRRSPPDVVYTPIDVTSISSDKYTLDSNSVLSQVAPDLGALGFAVESGKKKHQKVSVPVLFGRNGRVEKSFDVDAWHKQEGFVLEVEAGRATINNQFLKDLLEACLMPDVDYVCVAVRNIYMAGNIKNLDFERVVTFFETLYASRRLELPLKGIMVLGY